jgi:ankyrin repeat protein
LIQAGAALDITDINGRTALMGGIFNLIKINNVNQLFFHFKASVRGFTNVMNALIDAGANVNKTDSNSCSALTLGKKTALFI